MRRSRSSAEGWKDLGDDLDKEKDVKVDVVSKWGRFLVKYLKVRKLQLLFTTIGNHLSDAISRECRDRVSRTYLRE